MISRPVPDEVHALILQVDALIRYPEVKANLITDVHNILFKSLIKTHKLKNEEFTLATWFYIAGRQDVLDWLYQHTNQNPFENFFLLHWAVMCRQPEAIINSLVKHRHVFRNADLPHLTRYNSFAPLHLAVRENNPEIAEILIAASADVDAQKLNEDTPLHLAIHMDNLDMVKLLLRHKANINAPGKNDVTPLHLAMLYGNPDIIQELVAAGADLLIQDKIGNTALHLAFMKGNDSETYYNMLRHQNTAGIITCNQKNESPLSLAAANGNTAIIKRWLNTANAPDQQHIISALHLAANHGHRSTAQVLCCSLIAGYITTRTIEPEYLHFTYFFVKRGAGYSMQQKLDAARALLMIVEGKANIDTVQQHLGALNNKRLKTIYDMVMACYLNLAPQPENRHNAKP